MNTSQAPSEENTNRSFTAAQDIPAGGYAPESGTVAGPPHPRKKRGGRFLLFLLILLAAGGFLWWRKPWMKGYDNAHFHISTYHSSHDEDGDGVDDQTDILRGARKYVATRPEYKSEYYTTGYPTGHYGVCTDVVGAAMRNAGYDLMELVHEDVKKNRKSYPEAADILIDFRRVVNLDVWFSRNAAYSLTTDIHEIEEWQGGDIVTFEGHIGIVSDRRDADGIPYVIHHGRTGQKEYEEDILRQRDDIIGHYRMS